MVHIVADVGTLPALGYDMLRYPISCDIYPDKFIFRGPSDGSGGPEYVCAVAKFAIQSYLNHRRLPGWDVVSAPLVYHIANSSSVAWDDVNDRLSLLVVRPEDLEIVSSSEGSPGKRRQESAQLQTASASQPTKVLRRLRGKQQVRHSQQRCYSKCVTDREQALALGAGSLASARPSQSDGAGLAAHVGSCTGAGSPAWPEAIVGAGSAAHCGCRGNCGDKFCKSVQNKLTRKGRKVQADDIFCWRVPCPGEQFCWVCRCEFCDQKCRSKHDPNGRWCESCMEPVVGKTRLAYVTRSGHHNFNPAWPREIKFICKFNYALSVLDPGDVAAGQDASFNLWHRFGPPTAGKTVHTMVLFTLVWIHALKWPGAVHHFSRSLGQYKPSGDIVHDSVVMIRDSILHCSGRVWADVFAGMHSGGANFSHGPVALGRQLGILEKVSNGGSSPSSHRAGSSASSHDNIVCMGKEQMQYVCSAETSVAYNIIQYVLNTAEQTALTWPSNDADLVQFADTLKKFTMDIRSYRDENGVGLQGAGDTHLYTVKHFIRFVLLQLQGLAIDMNAIPWETVMEWTPDKSNHCDCFTGKSAGDVQNMIGLPALKVSMFACLAGKVATLNLTTQQWRTLMQVEDGEVMECIRRHQYAHKKVSPDAYWPPGCKELVQLLQKAGHV